MKERKCLASVDLSLLEEFEWALQFKRSPEVEDNRDLSKITSGGKGAGEGRIELRKMANLSTWREDDSFLKQEETKKRSLALAEF